MRRFVFLFLLGALAASSRVAAQTGTDVARTNIQLSAGDVVRISIWREPDLSGDFSVDENGMVVLPLIGAYQVGGVGIERIRDELIERYRQQLRNPAITITPLRRVNVLGEVRNPGLYPIDATVTLAGAVALAGGAQQWGDLNRIDVVRDGAVIRHRVGINESLSAADIRSGDRIVVNRRTWFDRNGQVIATALLTATGVIVSLLTR
jgi:protein involved in polysaccharide export with SLBB domain